MIKKNKYWRFTIELKIKPWLKRYIGNKSESIAYDKIRSSWEERGSFVFFLWSGGLSS